MNTELKRTILLWLLDHGHYSDKDRISHCRREFNMYIYDRQGEFLIGGREVSDFISSANAFLYAPHVERTSGAKGRIKAMLKSRKKSYIDIADMTGAAYQTVRYKMSHDSMKYNYVEHVADLLGYDIVFRDRETGREV